MPRLLEGTPQVSVRLYKTISRESVDGQTAVSSRYAGKDDFIDLTPFLQLGSAVRTQKSLREPAGGFQITFADAPQKSLGLGFGPPALSSQDLESVHGLVEPQDMIEIRMWGGRGTPPIEMPVIMRGFVTDISRAESLAENGAPQRTVTISGQDYGKVWQIYQVLYLAAYAEGKALLTTQTLFELFGQKAVNSMKAGEFVTMMVDKILNPFIAGFMPAYTEMPSKLLTDITVAHGQVNLSQQGMQGSIIEILRFHGDVGIWNELFIQDRNDGVYVVYRPVPALHLSPVNGTRLIQDDAPEPIYCTIPDYDVAALNVSRTDGNVANFFWVTNSRFDLIDDMSRKLAAIQSDSTKVSLKEYANASPKYYGLRPMIAETQMGGDEVTNQTSGQEKAEQDRRGQQQEAWIDRRRRHMLEMNRDNVVFERGTARVKGGPMRPDGEEAMKPGDYARIVRGNLVNDAYVVQVGHEFMPFQSYITTLELERGEGFANRLTSEGGASSPWLAEQASGAGRMP